MSALGIEPALCLVVYDDFDLALGTLRIRPYGGPGTHNGMRSIVNALGTDRFPRLRVGIGSARTDAARHVLERFTPDERTEIEISVAEATEAIEDWLASGDIERCMTRFHSRWNQGKPE
jgi:PTH1 family peptidyl-tRNA hydrolase